MTDYQWRNAVSKLSMAASLSSPEYRAYLASLSGTPAIEQQPVATKRDNYGLGSAAKKSKNKARNVKQWEAFQRAVA